jgi:hopanoid biosynthesis associated protein HpnK
LRPEADRGRGEGFPSGQLSLGLRYALDPVARRQLAAEIRAQFAAFATTGLPLDHANAHKHMHLHPTVGRLLVEIGREYGLRAVRVPAEPPRVLARCGARPGFGARALHAWTANLRGQVRRAGMMANDHTFGVAWSGHMTAARFGRLAAHLPPGLSEIYCHPAARRDPILVELMPEYEHEAEFAALLDSGVAAAFAASGAAVTDFSTEARRCSP